MKSQKVGRRLSARIGDLFKPKSKTEVATPAKVDEYPPTLEPVDVTPSEQPVIAEGTTEAVPEQSTNIETQPAVVAATA